MRKTKSCGVIVVLALSAIVGTGIVLADDDPTEISIQVAPATLNLNEVGEWVTVHTNISYSSVDLETLKLNDIPVARTKKDNCGNLVAKFNQTEVKEIVEGGKEDLTLTGVKTDGTKFTGTDTILVIDVGQ